MRRGWTLPLIASVAACAGAGDAAPPEELAPAGVLRVAVGVGAASSAFWATPDPASGDPRGVTVDLGAALAEEAGLPLELVVYPSSAAITEAGDRGEWDVTFMPVDAARAAMVDFGPAYYLSDSAILVPPGSALQTLDDVNAASVRVGAVEGTTTARSAAALFTRATMVYHDDLEALLTDVRAGRVDGMALGRESLLSLQDDLPGARVLEQGYNQTGVAIAVPKGRAAALAYVTTFIEDAKASGVVQRALREAGLRDATPAPPADAP